MPSEHRRRKDDTWTQDELEKSLKGSRDDRRRRGDGDRRHHGEDHDRRKRRDDGEGKSSRRHMERDASPEVHLTEEDRERLRRERREKKEKGGKEKPKQKEARPEKEIKILDDDDDDDRRRRHHRREEDGRKEKKSHREEESGRHRDDRHRERQHQERDRDHDRERRHKEKEASSRRHDEDRDEERRRRTKKESSSRHRNEDENKHRQSKDTESSSRHHRDDDVERQRRPHNGSDRRRHGDDDGERERRHRRDRDKDDDEDERERQRQERREKREKEKEKAREEGDRDRDRRSEKTSERSRDHRREEKSRDDERHRDDREDRYEGDRKSSHKTSASTPSFSVNGKHEKEEDKPDDDYNYEEDFEDYEDDFEDEEDPEMKEDGEMEEVLRALDEENNRLQSNSRRSNWSDSTELSDERFKDHRDEEERRRPVNVSRGKSFINFISAKQRVMDHTVASKARKRFTDLSKLIELDVARYDMFDLPPVGEYELYIRNFGRSDTKQAYIQTGDDDIEREVQTEEIESLSKWTQHPSDQDDVVGGEGIAVASSGEAGHGTLATDNSRLEKFLDRVGQFLFTILEEESISTSEERRMRDATPTASFSQSSVQLGFPSFLQGRQVKALSFCPSDPNSLLSIHTLPHEMTKDEKASPFDLLYVLCVWNLSQLAYPYRICVSDMTITCACFSPTKASLVFAGMHDGSVCLWDLREPSSQHRLLVSGGQTHVVRHATYMTAGVLETENHKSPVKAITPVHSCVVGSMRDEEITESSSGLSFQLASVEEKAIVNLWVVAEIPVPDPAGSETDLGLAPSGKIKLLRSSIIVLNNPDKYLSYSQELKALDLRLNPADLNHLYIPSDTGFVVHGVRFGKRAYPPAYAPSVTTPVPIVTIDFSPFGLPYFLAGCEDGTLYLFHTRSEHPIATWREFVTGERILSVRWSRSRPAVFFVLDNNSTILTFDLVENGLTPIKTDNIRTADAICMEVGSDPDLLTHGVNRPAQMAFALDNGTIECLSVSNEMRKQQPLEEDFLASYIDRF